jgi:imidazoleglycerol-phosphate dehydratase
MTRKCEIARKTRETKIALELNLDGTGTYEIKVPDPFLKHMIETLARYADFDIVLAAQGDLDHHLLEDVALTLGEALHRAVGEGPIMRLGSATVPMDDALAAVHVDLVDRPFTHIELSQEDLYEHFLRSFAMEARMTLHTQVLRGKDRHHIIEATFKALGRALHLATRPKSRIVSTKDKVRYEGK